jgi:hypothetical protein
MTTQGDWVWETRFGGGGYFLVARVTETPGFRQDAGVEAFIRRSGPPRPEDRPPPSVPLVFIPFDDWRDDDQDEDDRRFIAHARSDALRLFEELSALRWPTWIEDDKQQLQRSVELLQEMGFAEEAKLLRSLAVSGSASVWRDDDSISEC